MINRIDSAHWLVLHRVDGISAAEARTRSARRTHDRILQVTADLREGDRIPWGGLAFQRPLLNGTIDLAQVVNARVLLSCGARPDEVRYRNRRQEADDGHHDHDFYQRKRAVSIYFCFHVFCRYGVNTATSGLYIITNRCSRIARC